MKHQYFGDVNDYRKYSLLQSLSGDGRVQIGVCWMLTAEDERSDGSVISYLAKTEQYRRFSPDLFDFLFDCVHVKKRRHLSLIEASQFLPSASFHSDILFDDIEQRQVYFTQVLKRFAKVDLVFFDPDNGLEVKSKPIGRKGSSKYLYWCELQQAYAAGHSVLVYQHFAREKREQCIQRMVTAVAELIRTGSIVTFKTPSVLFLLVSKPHHDQHFCAQAEHIARIWGERHIAVQKHLRT